MSRKRKSKSKNIMIGLIVIAVAMVLCYKGILRSFFPIEYKDTIIKYSNEFEVNPNLVAAIIKQESKYNSRALSRKGAIGLMQIMPETGEWIAERIGMEEFTTDMLYNPEINIMMGAWYIDNLSCQFYGNYDLVIAAYNGGSGNVTKWLSDERYSQDGVTLKDIPFPETKKYLANVNRNLKAYTELYDLD